MKRTIVSFLTMVSILSLNSIPASAAGLDEGASFDSFASNGYVETRENIDGVTIDSVSVGGYDLVMGSHGFSFADHAWENDSVTYFTHIYRGSKDLGTVYCYYQDNVGTDKVQGSYNSSYFHYCNTQTKKNSSGLSDTKEPNVMVYNSKISYAPGTIATVQGFAYT